MNIIELVTRIKEKNRKSGVKLLRFIDVEDISDSRVCIDGTWTTETSAWGICWKDGKWVYFETDSERGYICGIERYETEEEACNDTYKYLSNAIKAEQEGYSHRDMAVRYLMNKNGYEKEVAVWTVDTVIKHEDIFEEMFNYMRISEYGIRGKELNEGGYSARQLVEEEGFSPVAAYRFLAELRDNKDEAEKALRNGKVIKE